MLLKSSKLLTSEGQAAQPFEYQRTFSPPAPAASVAADGQPEQELRSREKDAWKRGVIEGEARARAGFEEALRREHEIVSKAVKEFARQKEEYFHQVEGEAIHLALLVARKILHREAQLDPLLLSGVVRVALDKISAATSVKLRVQPATVSTWKKRLAELPDAPGELDVVGDSGLDATRVVLETSLGETELGLQEQLKEIEQGLFDLLALRPRAEPGLPESPGVKAESSAAEKTSLPARNRVQIHSDRAGPEQGPFNLRNQKGSGR